MLNSRNENTILRLLKRKNCKSSLERDKNRLHSFSARVFNGKSTAWAIDYDYTSHCIPAKYSNKITHHVLKNSDVHRHAITQTVHSYVHKYSQINSELLQGCVCFDRWMACSRSDLTDLIDWWYGNGSEALIQLIPELQHHWTVSASNMSAKLCKILPNYSVNAEKRIFLFNSQNIQEYFK